MNWHSTCIPISTTEDSSVVPRGLTPNRAYLCRWPDYRIDSNGNRVKERRIFSLDRPNNQGGWESEGFYRSQKPVYQCLYPVPLCSEFAWNPANEVPLINKEVLIYLQRWSGVNQRVSPGLYLGDCRESLAGPAWSVSRLIDTGLGGVVRVQELVCGDDVEWLPLPPVDSQEVG